MKTVELPNGLSVEDLLALARQESGIILTQLGQPVAQIMPVTEKPTKRISPLHPGVWEISPDFDDPLPDEFWLGKE